MLLLSINTIQHLNSIIPVYRFTGYKVAVTTRLSTAATKGWRTASGAAFQAKAQSSGTAARDKETSPKPNSVSRGFLLQSWVWLLREAKASLLQGRRRWKHHQPQASRVIPRL